MAFFTAGEDSDIDETRFTKYDNVRTTVVKFNDDKTRTLNNIMLKFYIRNIKNKFDAINGDNFELLKKRLKPELENIVMHYAKANYDNALKYGLDTITSNGTRITIPVHFLDRSDFDDQIIENNVKTLLDQFWHRIKVIELRNQYVQFQQKREKSRSNNEDFDNFNNNNELIHIDNEGKIKENDSTLDYSNYINSKARLIIFTAWNLGVTNAPTKVNTILEDMGFSGFDNVEYIDNNFAFRFKTKNDGRVDPVQCLPLHNKIFPINSKTIPIPPLHPHCRCILILVKKI